MKILILTRFYSGFHESVVSGQWLPTGMPALYKLIEGLNRKNINADILMLAKSPIDFVDKKIEMKFGKLENINFYILPFKGNPYNYLTKIINFFKHLWFMFNLLKKKHYQLYYCDRTNVAFGSVLTLIKKKVVLRLYGVANLCSEPAFKLGFIPAPEILCFHSRFCQVICSRDGSPVERFRDKYINRNIPYEILYNGVDNLNSGKCANIDIRRKYNLSDDKKIILTIGRLSPDKAIEEMVNSLVKLNKINQKYLAIIVGNGPLLDKLKHCVDKENLSDSIIFTGGVPHEQVSDYLNQADIFISLNMLGNLSNAVLEAMQAGKCIVSLKKCEISGRDSQTDDQELKDGLVLIDREKIFEQLPVTLDNLLKSPEVIEGKKNKIIKFAQKNFQSWEKRIDDEIEMLTKLIK